MGHATDQPTPEPSPAPLRENPIFRQPATVQACQQDYAAGADVRRRMDQQIARRS
ncbi:hypothetical protein [Streptomyces scabiei]|uniref:hypothetical protein n=1 Tax=Streptomyces scabiei TaxID=1930 RepID=UPI00131A9C49|nr:hypothetical protein [Streptomyces scabiei]